MASKLRWIVPVVIITLVLALIVVAAVIFFSPDKGTLSLECKKTIDLEIDGESFGSGSTFNIAMTTGSHEYTGTIKGLADSKMELKGTFTILKGQTTKVVCGEEPVVAFKSNPNGAQVSIATDVSQPLGKTPVDVHLPPGVYTFILNLDGQARKYGPIELAFDEKKDVEVFFGKPPKTGSIQGDSINITSTPEGIQIFKGSELVGVTPVSFSDAQKLFASINGSSIEIPVLFKRQHVWIHAGRNFDIAVSASPIDSSDKEWFANGGYFKSFIEDGFLKTVNNAGQMIQVKLPAHDTICNLSLYGGTIVFVGIKNDNLLISGYDATSLKAVEIREKEMFVAGFAKSLQSQDGTRTRHFSIVDGTLCEFDLDQMKVYRLGKAEKGLHLRRIGETEDFGVGLFNADGSCTGVLGRRYKLQLDGSWQIGGVQNVQPAIICFFKGTQIKGFNTGSGQVEWESTMQEEPLSISWNQNEQVWVAESLNSEKHWLIDPNSGTVTPLDESNTFAQKNQYPGFRGLGYFSTQDKMCQLFFNPLGILKCISDGQEIWSLNCEKVYSAKAFNPLTDVGQLYVKKNGSFYYVDSGTGKIQLVSQNEPVEFFENGAVALNDGVWVGQNRIFQGSAKVSQVGNNLKLVLNDGSSCVILP